MSSIIDDLDSALAENGEDAVLRRVSGAAMDVDTDVTVRVNVRRDTDSQNLAGNVYQDLKKVIMSPTQITAAGWPGTTTTGTAPFVTDTRIPVRGDILIIKGKAHFIEDVDPISVSGEIVRYEMRVKGAPAT